MGKLERSEILREEKESRKRYRRRDRANLESIRNYFGDLAGEWIDRRGKIALDTQVLHEPKKIFNIIR